MFWEFVIIGLQSIRTNLLRGFLTVLGIVIGVASFIAMVALSTGAQQAIDDQIQSLGTDILLVRPGNRYRLGVSEATGKLTIGDAHAILSHAGSVSAVVPEKTHRASATIGTINQSMSIIGTTPNFTDVHDYRLLAGRNFTVAEMVAKKRVAVVGIEVPARYRIDAMGIVGTTMYVRGIAFQVIGVLDNIGSAGWRNFDEQIWIPLETAQYRVVGTDELDVINVQLESNVSLELGIVDVERVMRREHRIGPGKNNDFSIGDPAEFLNVRKAANDVFAYLLAGVSSVSLIVGGIGIMNIMLVTVTERTREIGIRKALGATQSSILLQFLIESIILCFFGGLGGTLLGIGAANLMSHLFDWQVLVSLPAIAISLGFSVSVGLFFGLWPARKASLLHPIDALRYE
jgi:putative ABC transport system permease protein